MYRKPTFRHMKFKDIMGILALVSLLALLAVPAAAANTVTVTNNTGNDTATKFYNEGVTALSASDYRAALNLFDQALSSDTTVIGKSDVLLYVYQDKTYAQIQLSDYPGALETTTAGLALFGNDEKLLNNQGFVFYKLGRYQEALGSYNKAIGIDQNYTTALINKGDVLYTMARYQESVDAYKLALSTDPGNTDATAGLARAEQAAGPGLPVVPLLVLVVVIVAAGAVWYFRFRKPAEVPATGEKKGKGPSKKK